MVYKSCAVPLCTNTTKTTPEKLFVSVPQNAKMRKKWLQLARRDPKGIVVNSNLHFCEDHFDMEKDIANLTQYKMGFSKRLMLVAGLLPSKFLCQPDRRKRSHAVVSSRAASMKRQRTEFIQELRGTQLAMTTVPESSTTNVIVKQEPITTNESSTTNVIVKQEPITTNESSTTKVIVKQEPITTNESSTTNVIVNQETIKLEPIEYEHSCDKGTSTETIATADKSVQVTLKLRYRSKAVQATPKIRDFGISPYKLSTSSKSTSPFKITPFTF